MADITLTTISTLNGGSLTVTVYEDVGADGTGANTDALGNPYDNSASVALAGGVDETNTLPGFDATTGNVCWINVSYGALTAVTGTPPTFDSYTVSTIQPAPVSGTVTLDGTALSGAKITAINDTRGTIAGTATTDVNGAYSIDCPIGDTVHLVMEYDDGAGTRYQDESKPFVVVA